MRYVCTKCSIEKDELEFNRDNRNKKGRRADCKECQKAARRKKHPLNLRARKELIKKLAMKYKKEPIEINQDFQLEECVPEEETVQEETVPEEITTLISWFF